MSHIRLDSIALIDLSAEGQVVVSGSHGGASAAKFVLDLGVKPRLVFFNDAGGGKDDAGIVALTMLDAIGVACAVYSHESARIGDAQDGVANGVVTHVNSHARALRIAPFMQVADCFYIFK
jgi:hypothetical protein|tara:strand:- start:355 stop:717 length:363 start_codon:yes stop_codon:yes gene_type:complete